MHFEDLWNEAEQLLAEDTKVSQWEELARAASMKLSLLEHVRVLQEQDRLSEDDVNKLITNTMGRLLLAITQLSMKANIDVYSALRETIEREKVYVFEKRYK